MMIKTLFNLLSIQTVYAHCDIPCGIYDPHNMQMAAHTILRMTSFINELDKKDPKKLAFTISRVTKVKEEHAELVKHEIRILWGDYFKEEHLKDFPNLHDLVFKTLKLASKARQSLEKEVALELINATQEIAEIFYKTKDLEPVKISSGYPTEGELVIHK